jgi:K+-transporting ATPase A subunit
MTANGWLQILFFLLAIAAITPPLGAFMARVFTRQRTFLDPVLRPLERVEDQKMKAVLVDYSICLVINRKENKTGLMC